MSTRTSVLHQKGRGSGAVVKAACLESRISRVRTPLLHSSFKKTISPPPRSQDAILWGASTRRCSVLGLKPPGFEFQILCLEGSVISFFSSSYKVILTQFSLCVHKGGIKPHLFDVYMSVMKIY